MDNSVVIITRQEFEKILEDKVSSILEKRIPQIIRGANRKAILTTAELKELTGMSARVQKYHRDQGNLPYSRTGRKIFYETSDVEKFMAERRIEPVYSATE